MFKESTTLQETLKYMSFSSMFSVKIFCTNFALMLYTSSFAKKKPVDFDDELRIGDVRYDNMI